MVPPKLITAAHSFISTHVDTLVHDMEIECAQDREMERAYREATRAQNMITHRDEIKSRPKTEWIMSKKEKETVKKGSKKELKHLKSKFDETVKEQSHNKKQREKKREEKL